MKSLSSRKKVKAYSSFQLILILAIIVLINVAVSPLSARIDLTDGKIYTLSNTTKDIVQKLPDVVTITEFFSKEFPPELIAVKQQTEDLLGEYNKISSHIKVVTKDPKQDEEAAKEAADLGIPELQFNLYKSEEFQVTTGYSGISIAYGDDVETIPVINDASTLEYDITSAILKLTSEKIPTVAFASGHNEVDTTDIQTALEKNYNTATVDLSTGDPIADDISTLVLAGPQTEFSDRSLYVLDQFIMRGGKVMFFLDGVIVDQMLSASPNESRLNQLLNSYGVSIGSDIVLDPKSYETLRFNTGYFTVVQPYPLWPRITKEKLNSSSPITAPLETLTVGWASSLSPVDSKLSEKTVFTPLASTTDNSWLLDEQPFVLAPDKLALAAPSDKQSYVIAGHLTGHLTSFFDGKDVPAHENADSAPQSENFQKETDDTSIVIVSDSEMIQPQTLSDYPGNGVFTLNAVDALAQDASLITIRSRGALSRPLDPVEDSTKIIIKYLNIFASALLAIIFGLVLFFLRKRQDAKIVRQFQKHENS